MSIQLNSETERLIEQCMQEGGFASVDELVCLALRTLDGTKEEDFEELDAETKAAIDEGEAQFERGEGRPWEEVKEELRARFIKP